MYKKYIKRMLDVIISFLAIIILTPVLIILLIIGSIVFKGNPLFIQ